MVRDGNNVRLISCAIWLTCILAMCKGEQSVFEGESPVFPPKLYYVIINAADMLIT